MEARQGIKLILLWRLFEKAGTEKATKLAFQEKHSIEAKIDGGDAKLTKDGPITTKGNIEEEVPFESTMGLGDPVADMLDEAFYAQKLLELWEVDLNTQTEGGSYNAEYRRGRLIDLTKNADAEDTVMLEGTFKTDGIRQKGEVTLTAEQEEIVQYAFRDTDEVDEVEEVEEVEGD